MLTDVTEVDHGRRRDRARTPRGAAGARADHRAVLGTVGRGRPRVAVVLRDEPAGPDGRRAQPRRQVLPGHDPRRPHATGCTGTRGTTAYLGFQILAGIGLTPRRMAGYVSDTELPLRRRRVRAGAVGDEPSAAELGGARGCRSPRTRRRSSCASTSATRPPNSPRAEHRAVDPVAPQPLPDDGLAEQFTAMAWTLMKLATLHRTIKPELLTTPNVLLTAEAAELGSADTTPDNLYMIGTFRLAAGRRCCSTSPRPTPATGTSRWRTSGTSASTAAPAQLASPTALRPDADGMVRIAISAKDFGDGHWLDTGGRHRGFVDPALARQPRSRPP